MDNNPSTTIREKENRVLEKAYHYVENAINKCKPKEYKSYVKKFPMMVQTNGLAAAVAFIKGKSKKTTYAIILNDLTEWLRNETKGIAPEKLQGGDLLKSLAKLNSTETRIVTREALNLFSWLRRLADAQIED